MFKSFKKLFNNKSNWLIPILKDGLILIEKEAGKDLPLLTKFFQDLDNELKETYQKYGHTIPKNLIENLTENRSIHRRSDIEIVEIAYKSLLEYMFSWFRQSKNKNSFENGIDYIQHLDSKSILFKFIIKEFEGFLELKEWNINNNILDSIFYISDSLEPDIKDKIIGIAFLWTLVSEDNNFTIDEKYLFNQLKWDFNSYKKPLEILSGFEYYDTSMLWWDKLSLQSKKQIKVAMIKLSIKLLDYKINIDNSKENAYVEQLDKDQIIEVAKLLWFDNVFDKVFKSELSDKVMWLLILTIQEHLMKNSDIISEYNNTKKWQKYLPNEQIKVIQDFLEIVNEWEFKEKIKESIIDNVKKSKLKNSITKKDFLNDIWLKI